jgi:hypothetical protein
MEVAAATIELTLGALDVGSDKVAGRGGDPVNPAK